MNAIIAVLLLNAVLVVPIAILAWVTMRLFRRPAIAHALWVLALVKLLTPPLVSPEWIVDPQTYPTLAAILPSAHPVDRPAGTDAPVVIPAPSQDVGELGSGKNATLIQRFESSPSTLVTPAAWSVVGLIWITGSLVCLGLFLRRIGLVGRLIRSSGHHDSRASAMAESLFGVSLRTPPRVILVDAVISPTLIGVGPWTSILYPRTLWDELPGRQRDGLLLHELEHFRRGDHWVRLLEAAARIVFWWHPVIWWARHHIELTEESCCDAVAARASDDDISYAEALLTTLDFINDPHWSPSVPLTTGASGRLPMMEQRLRQIVRHSIAGRLSHATRFALVAIALFVLPIQPLLLGGRTTSSVSFTRPLSGLPLAQPKTITSTPIVSITEPIYSVEDLPPAPKGWWSEQPVPAWEHSPIADDPDAARLIVDASGKILLKGGNVDGTIDLSSHQITAAAFWQSSKRLITGDANGNVRMWDVASGEPVTKFGKHHTEVTSLAISGDNQLITGGRDGTLISWDLNTGDSRQTWATNGRPIQSVRLFDQGRKIAVIAGQWQTSTSRIVILDASNLEAIFDRVTDGALATSRFDDGQLTFVDWAGNVSQLDAFGDLVTIGQTAKGLISAYVFSQDARVEITPDQNVIRS